MPNLREKTWTTSTPASVEDAQYWEDHLIGTTEYNAMYAAMHSHGNKEKLDSYTQTNEDLTDAVNKKHSHSNKTDVLDKLSKNSNNKLTFDGTEVGNTVDSAMSSTSTNPVQNKVITKEVNDLKADIGSLKVVNGMLCQTYKI